MCQAEYGISVAITVFALQQGFQTDPKFDEASAD